jgi:5-methylcytosine-specific restriction protein A
MAKPQYSGPWAHIRLYVLARDNYLCQIKLKGCTTTATTADHIVPLADGGTHDPDNCRAACLHCNSSLGAQLANRRWQRPQPSRQW